MEQQKGSTIFLVLALLSAAGMVVTYLWSAGYFSAGPFAGVKESVQVQEPEVEEVSERELSRPTQPTRAPAPRDLSQRELSPREAQRERLRQEEEAMRERLREGGEVRAAVEWMAQPEDVDVDAIERRLDQGEMDRDFELALREDAQAGREVLEESVQLCMVIWRQRSEAAGDELGLRWRLRTDAGRGSVEDVEVVAGAGLDQGLRECVEATTAGLTFEASGDGADVEVNTRVQLRGR